MGTVGGSPPLPPLPPRRKDMPTAGKKEELKRSESIGEIFKQMLRKMGEMLASLTSSEATRIIAELNRNYLEGKNSFTLYGFARPGELQMPHRGSAQGFPPLAIQMGDIFQKQKSDFLKSLESVKDPVHKNWLLKRFDNYRMNVFVASANEMARNPRELARLFEEFKQKAENQGGGKTFSQEIQQVIEAEKQGKVLDKGHWSKKIL